MWALVAPVCIALLGWMTLAIYLSPVLATNAIRTLTAVQRAA